MLNLLVAIIPHYYYIILSSLILIHHFHFCYLLSFHYHHHLYDSFHYFQYFHHHHLIHLLVIMMYLSYYQHNLIIILYKLLLIFSHRIRRLIIRIQLLSNEAIAIGKLGHTINTFWLLFHLKMKNVQINFKWRVQKSGGLFWKCDQMMDWMNRYNVV